MKKRSKTKRRIASLLLAVGMLMTFTSFAATAYAQDKGDEWCNEVKEATGGWIGCGEEEITFTKFKGGYQAPVEEGYAPGLTRVTDARSFIRTFVNFATGFLGLIAVVIIIIGGFLYVTAAGEQERADKGKKAIQYALIGILIIMASFAIVNTLITEPFSEENIQDGSVSSSSSSSSSSSDGLVGGVLSGSGSGSSAATPIINADGSVTYTTSFNPLAGQVQSAATNLIGTYSLYKEVLAETSSITGETAKPTLTQGGYNSMVKFLNSMQSRLSRIEDKLPLLSNTKDKIDATKGWADRTISELDAIKAQGGDDVNQKLANKFSDVLINRFMKTDGTEGSVKAIGNAMKKDLSKVIDETIEVLLGRPAKDGLPAKAGIKQSVPPTMADVNALITNLASDTVGLGKLKSSLPNGDNSMLNVLALFQELFASLRNIQFVKASISADIIEGHAPLVVNFNMLNSVDPAGGTITCGQIYWDLQGDGSSAIDADECKDNIDHTFVSHVYTEPGVYQAAVTIASKDPNKFAPGFATVPIKVLPATAQVKMKITDSSGSKSKDMVVYSSDGTRFLFDKKSVKFTLDEAKAGIKFDPGGTTSGEGTKNKIEVYSYDFGDGTEESFTSAAAAKVLHSYGEAGTYQVTFEVKDDKGNKNRKIFDLIVSSPVARIVATPNQSIFLGEEVFFNATSSSSQVGQIVSYEWNVTDESGTALTLSGTDKNADNFRHTFDKHGTYEITLTVKDTLGDSSQDQVFVNVSSKAPISKFNHNIPNNSQPSTLQLSAIKSYDPDGDILDPSANYKYIWKITPDTYTNIEPSSSAPDPTSISSLNRLVRFNEKGEYKVSFLVEDSQGQGEAFENTIVVNDILDVSWKEGLDSAEQLNSDGEATFNFEGISQNGTAFEIDFGDGEIEGGDISKGSSSFSKKHTYYKAGKYKVALTVFDDDDNDKSITRQVFVGDGSKPVAAIKVFVDGVEKDQTDDKIEVNRSSVITFDAGDSKNTDGTGRRLSYNWDFDDTTISTKRSSTHTYKELSPSKGYYEVELEVSDQKDQSKKDQDSVKIYVLSEEPELLGLNAVPQSSNNMETPIRVKVSAIGANDKDGQIIKYRWYYYDIANSSNELGVQITESPVAFLNIGTMGKAGKKKTYRFAVEMTDNENNTITSGEVLNKSEIPQVTVTNGPNEAPIAKFKIDKTNVFVNDTVNFSSNSNDPDGEIISYVWDFEGDGFSNNTKTSKATVSKKYKKAAADGIPVRLKVIDDKFGEAISSPIKIYVQSKNKPPIAAFKYSIIGGKKVQFDNNSKPSNGPKIKNYIWDFDTSSNAEDADSDGDGIKDNDKQSAIKNPIWSFEDYGIYKVKLTAIDSDGNEDSVENIVNIPAPADTALPKAAFKFKKIGPKTVEFINNSTNQGGPPILTYIWDFDTDSIHDIADSDGDGNKDNDEDSFAFEPSFEYPLVDKFKVKLTVIDESGNQDEVINELDLKSASIGEVEGVEFSGTTGSLKAKVITDPPIDPKDGKIHILGTNGDVTFDFSKSSGDIVEYVIDKNIFFDTDGNGVPNDDVNASSKTPGTWKSNFDKSWGKIVVKLTVLGKSGNTDSQLVEIVFTSPFGLNTFATNQKNLFGALVTLLAFVILSGVVHRRFAREK